MQFDQTNIVVRERGMLEILDLSLHVLVRYFRPLSLMWLLGIVPMAILNHLLVGQVLNGIDFQQPFAMEQFSDRISFYWFSMSLLVLVEAPLATAFMTKYLGEAVFRDEIPVLPQVRSVLRAVGPLSWTQLFLRGVLIFWVLAYMSAGSIVRDAIGIEDNYFLFIILLFGHALIRGTRPYVTEIILLETNVSRSRPLSLRARSKTLHTAGGAGTGLVMGRALGSFLIGVMLVGSIHYSLVFLSGILWNDWEHGALLVQVGYPLAMWIVVGFLAVSRFLSYLDCRIRYEGWEVELRLRAESNRMRERDRVGGKAIPGSL